MKARATLRPMGKVKIRYFVEKPGAAGARFFWQPAAALRVHGWHLVRLPDTRGQALAKAEQLNAELDAWRRGEAAPHAPAPPKLIEPRTLSAVIRTYRASRFFTELRPRTKRGYAQNIAFLEQWAGDMRAAAITPKVVETLYSSMRRATPAKAAAVITMLRILLEAARREGFVTTNAASRAGIKGSAPSGRIWPREAVRLFVATADAMGLHSIGSAVMINHWLGQREGDILALTPAAVAGGRITLTQSKTGAKVSIPDNAAVRARILAELACQDARAQARRDQGATPLPASTLLVCEATGRPWREDHFRHSFAAVRAALAAAHPTIAHADGTMEQSAELLFKNLRHTAVTEMAIAGCTTPQIAGITGHSLAGVNHILSRYLSRTADLADAAAAKRTAYDQARREGA